MANIYFNNFNALNEQVLLEDLIIESIGIYGIIGYYITRTINKLDKIYQADDQSSYTQAFLIDYYLENVLGYGGDRDFMGKFGLEIRDQITVCVARRTFQNEIGEIIDSTRPREGDLVYFPHHKKCFTIKYVDAFQSFYQLGTLYTWKITCELLEYSSEVFNTGIPEIDILQQKYSLDMNNYSLTDENGLILIDENDNIISTDEFSTVNEVVIADNEELQKQAELIMDFNIEDPFSDYANKQL